MLLSCYPTYNFKYLILFFPRQEDKKKLSSFKVPKFKLSQNCYVYYLEIGVLLLKRGWETAVSTSLYYFYVSFSSLSLSTCVRACVSLLTIDIYVEFMLFLFKSDSLFFSSCPCVRYYFPFLLQKMN